MKLSTLFWIMDAKLWSNHVTLYRLDSKGDSTYVIDHENETENKLFTDLFTDWLDEIVNHAVVNPVQDESKRVTMDIYLTSDNK